MIGIGLCLLRLVLRLTTMTDPAFDPRTTPLRELPAVVAAREGALAAWRHSPNRETSVALHRAHDALNKTLEQLWDAMTLEQRDDADGRKVRELVTA